MNTTDYLKGYRNGIFTVTAAVRDILDNSENAISILQILALLERKETEVEAALARATLEEKP